MGMFNKLFKKDNNESEDMIAVFAINNKDIPYEKKDYIYR